MIFMIIYKLLPERVSAVEDILRELKTASET